MLTASNSKGKVPLQFCINCLFLLPLIRDKEPELQMEKTRHLVRMVRADIFLMENIESN